MAKKLIYLDSSVPSALFDARNPERQEHTRCFWETLRRYDVFISTLVFDELSCIGRAGVKRRDELLALIEGMSMYNITLDVKGLAEKYISGGIVARKHLDDMQHLACATVHGVDYVVSWNFRHMVKVHTRKMVNAINTLNDYDDIEIVAPIELDVPNLKM